VYTGLQPNQIEYTLGQMIHAGVAEQEHSSRGSRDPHQCSRAMPLRSQEPGLQSAMCQWEGSECILDYVRDVGR
jgi:hypothetical protein